MRKKVNGEIIEEIEERSDSSNHTIVKEFTKSQGMIISPRARSCIKRKGLVLHLNKMTRNDMSVIIEILPKLKLKFIRLKGHDKVYSEKEINEIMLCKDPSLRGETCKERGFAFFQLQTKLASKIADFLGNSDDIHLLEITKLQLMEENLKKLSRALLKNSSLKELKLTECNLTSKDFLIFSKSLAKTSNLNIIDLSNNNLNVESGCTVGAIISEQGQKKNEIIWLKGLRGERPEEGFYKKGLCEIILAGNNLGDQGSQNLIKNLKFDNWLRSLDMRDNGISPDGIVSFIKLLKQNESLLSLDLRENKGLNRKASQIILNCLTRNMIKFKSDLKNNKNPSGKPKSQIQDSEKNLTFDILSNKSPEQKRTIFPGKNRTSLKSSKFRTAQRIKMSPNHKPRPFCSRCRELESKLMKSESEIIELKLELTKLKEERKEQENNTISLNNGYNTFNFENISRNIDEIRNYPVESIQRDTPQFISKIEVLMSELTRIMDGLEPGTNQNNNTVLAMDHLSNTSSNYYNNTINYDQNNQTNDSNQITFDLNEEDLELAREQEEAVDLNRTVSARARDEENQILDEEEEEEVQEGPVLDESDVDSDDTYNPYKQG